MAEPYSTMSRHAHHQAFDPARECFEDLVVRLAEDAAIFALDLDELESFLHDEGRELLRKMLQAHLDRRAPARALDDVVCEAGVTRTFTRNTSRQMRSRFGIVEVKRVASCTAGHRQRCLLDADLNLAHQKLSRHVQKLVCEHCRDMAFETAAQTLKEITGSGIGNRQLEETVQYIAQDFEPFYEQREGVTTGNDEHVLVLSTDGKGVKMIERDLRPATREKARERRARGDHERRRQNPGEKRSRKRMATVAAVYDHVPNPRTADEIMSGSQLETRREAIQNKRVWADLEAPTAEVVADVFEEARRRDPDGARQWVVLVDGDPHQMNAVMEQVNKVAEDGVATLVIVDLVHVAEYLWRAANALLGARDEHRADWVREQIRRLLLGEARRVIHGMRVSAGKRSLAASRLETVRQSARYMEERLEYLRYDEAIEVGLPIATGVIEGACRHLVNDRLGITGARWSLATAQAILRLRALRSSGDWEAYWSWHKRHRHEQEHAAQYADRVVPQLIYTASREHLSPVV